MGFLPGLFSQTPVNQTFRDLEKNYDRMLREWPFGAGTMREFAVDVEEQKDKYVVTADLPGVKKENIEISMNDGTLLIQARESKSSEKKDANYIVRERSSMTASRAISLLNGDENGAISAEFKDGTLTVTVPKVEDKKIKKIAVK